MKILKCKMLLISLLLLLLLTCQKALFRSLFYLITRSLMLQKMKGEQDEGRKENSSGLGKERRKASRKTLGYPGMAILGSKQPCPSPETKLSPEQSPTASAWSRDPWQQVK